MGPDELLDTRVVGQTTTPVARKEGELIRDATDNVNQLTVVGRTSHEMKGRNILIILK